MKSRSSQKNITKQAIVLRYMRHSRNLSLNQAGKKLNISGSAIAHMEQGRMDISRKRIETMIESYGYTPNEYLEFFDGKNVPINYRDECIMILRRCDEEKIQVLYSIITNLVK
jgi:transcriptional regulator with XRE-family HTH domain